MNLILYDAIHNPNLISSWKKTYTIIFFWYDRLAEVEKLATKTFQS